MRAGASRIHDDNSFGNETLGDRILSENTLLTRKKPNTELMSGRFAKDHALPVGMYNNDVKKHAWQSNHFRFKIEQLRSTVTFSRTDHSIHSSTSLNYVGITGRPLNIFSAYMN